MMITTFNNHQSPFNHRIGKDFMNYLKKRLQIIANDSFLSLTIKIALVLSTLHIYRITQNLSLYEHIGKLTFCATYPLVVFFTGRKGSYISFFVFANFLTTTQNFSNYAAFLIIAILCIVFPKYRFYMLGIYCLDIICVGMHSDSSFSRFAIHIANCMLIYYSLKFLIKPSLLKKKLDLTVDETSILKELSQGKQQKEIENFSQNTVSRKLKKARERNGVATTDELIKRFKEELTV